MVISRETSKSSLEFRAYDYRFHFKNHHLLFHLKKTVVNSHRTYIQVTTRFKNAAKLNGPRRTLSRTDVLEDIKETAASYSTPRLYSVYC